MIDDLTKLLHILPHKYKTQLALVAGLSFLLAILEVLSVAGVGPLVHQLSSVDIDPTMSIVMGSAILILLISVSLLSVYCYRVIVNFSQKLGLYLSRVLLNHYMHENWLFHVATTNAELIHKLTYETTRLVQNVVNPLLVIASRSLFVLVLLAALCVYQPLLTIGLAAVFIVCYLLIFLAYQGKLIKNGSTITAYEKQKLHLLNESLGAIKEIKMQSTEPRVEALFSDIGGQLADARANNQLISALPKHILELVVLCSVVIAMLVAIVFLGLEINQILPFMAVYLFAALKLLPAFHTIYSQATTVRANQSALDYLIDDLIASEKSKLESVMPSIVEFKHVIQLCNLSFKYNDLNKSAVQNLSLVIPKNTSLGIVGSSGSGKSTLVNLILQLINQQQGTVKVDDCYIDDKNRKSWQKLIGLVGQEIYIANASIEQNIALGFSDGQIDLNRVNYCLELALLRDWIHDLVDGTKTIIGERGLTLSGGQRQRLAIARALYLNTELLVFDEATSSLDNYSESQIVKAINGLHGQKTMIIVAHRLSTVKHCDNIIVLDRGCLVGQGTYQSLLANSDHFQKLALVEKTQSEGV